jgi:site-specific DNA-methyltransferase (cytosine-N4-specific)
MGVDYRVGDVRDVLGTIEDDSIALLATSPPFLALRSYLPAGHDHKHAEIGSEANPAVFLDTLLALTAEWGRVLAPWGSIAIELGDTYAGSGGAGGDYGPVGLRDGQPTFDGSAARTRSNRPGQYGTSTGPPRRTMTDAWPRAKSLALVPQLYAVALAYGINPLTGAPSPAGRWRVRNVIVWHRPNPAVGALGDKVRPSTSYIVVATRSAKRWFDLTAVRTPPKAPPQRFFDHGYDRGGNGATHDRPPLLEPGNRCDPAGAPPLDCWFDEYDGSHDTWTLTTQPSSLAHYAMWPAKLAERLILSMCPAQVCAVCGEPRRRVEKIEYSACTPAGMGWAKSHRNERYDENMPSLIAANRSSETLGWSDCGHGTFIPGRILDPFAGTGTTLAVADLHGRDAIGIDLDARNRELYPRRREECARALFDTRPEIPGQLSLMGEI